MLQFNERGAQLPLFALMPKRKASVGNTALAVIMTAQPPFPGFGGRVPMPDLTGELADFHCRPWRHDTLRRVVVGYFCLSFSHILIFIFFVCLFTLSRYGPSCRRLLSGGDCIAFFAAAPLLRPTALSSRGPGHDRHNSETSSHKCGSKTTNAGRKSRRTQGGRNAKPALSSC